MHGYELKSAFEEQVGTLWDLNIGQVYNTLRLAERDGLVQFERSEQEGRGPARKVYAITDSGRQELERWLLEPVRQPRRLKDEFYVKLVFTRLTQGDVSALIRPRCCFSRAAHSTWRQTSSGWIAARSC
jgi:DNA-binding PadR family transcriptional regulator